jgi:hypothetical protein
MNRERFQRLEQALRARNPLLVERLRPGRTSDFLRQRLAKEGAAGHVQPVLDLFCWRDGTALDESVPQDQASPFPGSGQFMFLPFTFIVGHFSLFRDYAKYHNNMRRVAGRYFPLFWNGSKGTRDWIAVDLEPSQNSRVVLLDTHADDPIYTAYLSFEEFLEDAIRANCENRSLRCL